ncbi:hypothetical protein [Methylobacterium sp. GC_Met_2]|uniref:hypothetical protein n=1 Tax=Methylobacterium sp. GC_Met_2 TaxID=2937376 RepID=UPI00226B5208|nr:hypothetical protein [Methylobacterium sp. GC_Met_2]
MTRLQQARVRRAKLRVSQDHLEIALDEVIPKLSIPPSEAFEAVLAYSIDGLVAQGTLRDKDQALALISRVLTKHGMIG